jgi:hypothetical protein
MIYKLLKARNFLLLASLAFTVLVSCQKKEKPALGNYPKDSNPPGGPLKFYASFDGSHTGGYYVDSIRANFGTITDATLGAGISGQALQIDGSKNGFVAFPSANDFAKSTNFTIAFWINTTLAQKDHNNADAIMALASTKNFWSNFVVFADHEPSTSDSMQLKFHFANGDGDNWDFAGYSGDARWPKMYDGQWHHVAFVYDASSKTATLYRDGVQFDQKTNETIAFDQNASELVVGGFQEAAGIVSSYADNTWMSGFPGLIDQVRLYSTALAAADVAALYANKQ